MSKNKQKQETHVQPSSQQLSSDLQAKIDALTPEEQDLLLEKLLERQKNKYLAADKDIDNVHDLKSRPLINEQGKEAITESKTLVAPNTNNKSTDDIAL